MFLSATWKRQISPACSSTMKGAPSLPLNCSAASQPRAAAEVLEVVAQDYRHGDRQNISLGADRSRWMPEASGRDRPASAEPGRFNISLAHRTSRFAAATRGPAARDPSGDPPDTTRLPASRTPQPSAHRAARDTVDRRPESPRTAVRTIPRAWPHWRVPQRSPERVRRRRHAQRGRVRPISCPPVPAPETASRET